MLYQLVAAILAIFAYFSWARRANARKIAKLDAKKEYNEIVKYVVLIYPILFSLFFNFKKTILFYLKILLHKITHRISKSLLELYKN